MATPIRLRVRQQIGRSEDPNREAFILSAELGIPQEPFKDWLNYNKPLQDSYFKRVTEWLHSREAKDREKETVRRPDNLKLPEELKETPYANKVVSVRVKNPLAGPVKKDLIAYDEIQQGTFVGIDAQGKAVPAFKEQSMEDLCQWITRIDERVDRIQDSLDELNRKLEVLEKVKNLFEESTNGFTNLHNNIRSMVKEEMKAFLNKAVGS